MKKSTTLLCFLIVTMNGFANVYHVPANYSTIQSALDACNAGDTILVEPGTYIENIIWPSTAGIKLISTGDSSNTIIDGNAAGTVISMYSAYYVDTTTLLRGFTIRNGKVTGEWAFGAGIYLDFTGAVFENDLITANHCVPDYYYYGYGGGAGAYCNYGIAVFRNCQIIHNVVDSGADYSEGGGIGALYSTIILDHSSVSENTSYANDYSEGGGIETGYSILQLVNVTVSGNALYSTGFPGGYLEGFGIDCFSTNIKLTNVLINGNIAYGGGNFYQGGGLYIDNFVNGDSISAMNITVTDNHKFDYSSMEGSGAFIEGVEFDVVNSILWNENPGSEIDSTLGGSFNITYSDVRGGYSGAGNINTLPGFVSATDFHLMATSPCINAGTALGAPGFDLDNNPRPSPASTNPDMGCFETDQSLTGCAADFSLVPDSLLLHHYWAVNLATGSGTLSYVWSWGDGTYDSIAFPSHTYAAAGFYTICLSIQDSTGCFDSTCINYNIQKLSQENTIVKVDVVESIPTTIQDINVLQSWSVFPNPSSGNSFINYTLSTPAAVSIALFDVLGNKLQQLVNGNQEQGEHNATLDARKLANGVYVLQIRAGEQLAEEKIVLLR